jgi:UDP-N-acetylmuramoyl-tripeptide--D-alanyl-D-alanine ligase
MNPATLDEVAAAIGGVRRAQGPFLEKVRGAAVDSRRIERGDLFFALPGDGAGGHPFVGDALARGASGAIVARTWRTEAGLDDRLLIEVGDTRGALLDLARHERAGLTATVVGITGSTGKTCTKDFMAAVLAERLRVVASEGSFNNEVGLPLTVLGADARTEALVCEMGSRGIGHIRRLCDIARPNVGVVTNVGEAHMELFGTPDVLRDAKAELPEALPPEGTAVLNADDATVSGFRLRTAARVVMFGADPTAEVRAEGLTMDRDSGCASFDLVLPGGSAPVTLPTPGGHMVPNALGAAAVGWTFGLSAQEAARGLASARVSTGRMEIFETPDGLRVVNDAYNANPTSMAAALKAAKWMAGDARCVAVLGWMAELGPIGPREHLRIGELLARLGIDGLVVVGEEARLIAQGAAREGVEPERIAVCEYAREAAPAARRMAGPGDLVLVKASRAARLERVAEDLRFPNSGHGAGVTGVLNGTAG